MTGRKIIVLALLVFSFVACARAEMSAAKRSELEKMFHTLGMERLVAQAKQEVVAALKETSPGMADEVGAKLAANLDTRELLRKLVAVYDKYYTLEDLRAINAFYASSAGRKVAAATPQVMQECLRVSREWVVKAGQEAMAEMVADKLTP